MAEKLPIVIGFTGSRNRMNALQETILHDRWVKIAAEAARLGVPVWLIHGGCHGSDLCARDLARSLGFLTRCYPGDELQYHESLKVDTETRPPCYYLDRNHRIVRDCGELFATPKEDQFHESQRSGTWATIRYARSVEKRRQVICSDGVIRR